MTRCTALCVSLVAAACAAPQTAPSPDAHPGAPSYADAVARIAMQQRQDDSVALERLAIGRHHTGRRAIAARHVQSYARLCSWRPVTWTSCSTDTTSVR